MRFLIILLLCSSCALFKTKSLDRNISKAAKSVCLSSSGKGRLEVLGSKNVFSYESAIDEEAANWELALSFPLHEEERFKIDWSEHKRIKFTTSIEEKILKENKNINPRALNEFTQYLGYLLYEIIQRRNPKNTQLKSKFSWQVTNKDLTAATKSKRFAAEFTNLAASGYFGLMRVSYKNQDKQSYKLDLVVRNCHE